MKVKRIAVILLCLLLLGALGLQLPVPESGTLQPRPGAVHSPQPGSTEASASSPHLQEASSPAPRPTLKPTPTPTPVFADVLEGQWYAAAVNALEEMGVIERTKDGLFHPEGTVGRAEILKMLAILSQKEIMAREDRSTFEDVPRSAWYFPYVCWALKEKLLTGMEGENLVPEGCISRQELAVLLYRFNKNVMGLRFPKGEPADFRDQSSISTWADVEVAAVVGAGLMKGYEDGYFSPHKAVSRGEMASILYRYVQDMVHYRTGCPIDDFRFVSHAGGLVEGSYNYTNSLEALEETDNWGNRVVEIDFCWSSDDQLVCLHNWGGKHPEKCTLEEFLKTKVYEKFTPMGLDQLAQWMRDHPDTKIVTDFKEGNVYGLQEIAQRYPDLLDRFFPYIYHTKDHDWVHSMGYENIVLFTATAVADGESYQQLAEFARRNEMVGMAVNAFTESAAYAPARQAGMPVYAYTVNNEQQMYEFTRQGADGFVTDLQDAMIRW